MQPVYRPGMSAAERKYVTDRTNRAWRNLNSPRHHRNDPVVKAVGERLRNTLGNEFKEDAERRGRIQSFQRQFSNDWVSKSPLKDLYEKKKRQRLTPTELSKLRQDQYTLNARMNTAIRKNFKDDLKAMDAFQNRRDKYQRAIEDDLISKGTLWLGKDAKGFRQGVGTQHFANIIQQQRKRHEDTVNRRKREYNEWAKWAKQHDPKTYKRISAKEKEGGYFSTLDRPSSSRFQNLRDYYKALEDSRQKHYRWKWGKTGSTWDDPRPKQPEGMKRLRELVIRGGVQKQFDDAARKNAEKQLKAQTDKQLKSYYNQLSTPAPRKKPRYNQAAYLAGLQSAPMMTMGQKMNQGIYKPYANGGGVRKPKYNKKG